MAFGKWRCLAALRGGSGGAEAPGSGTRIKARSEVGDGGQKGEQGSPWAGNSFRGEGGEKGEQKRKRMGGGREG